jgi:hypothetical protein
MTTAVLLFTSTRAFNIPGWVFVVGLMVAATFGAVATWIASAKTRRQKFARLFVATAATTTLAIIGDTCWVPDWLCLLF